LKFAHLCIFCIIKKILKSTKKIAWHAKKFASAQINSGNTVEQKKKKMLKTIILLEMVPLFFFSKEIK
jgi:hypothetical protein